MAGASSVQAAGGVRGRSSRLSTAQWVLAGLIVAGIGLRIFAIASFWPVTTTLADAWPYAYYAETNPLDNPQHPAGYSAILAMFGAVSREVAFSVLLQHLLGIASALLLYGGVRRVTDSPWPGLVPAAVVLLGADQVYLEHSIMSEAPFVFLLSLCLYACVRAIGEPDPWWRWPLVTGLAAAAATGVRAAGVFLIPILIVGVVLSRPRPWLPAWRAPAALAAGAAALLIPYVIVIGATTDGIGVAPSSGWHLYHRVAPFADCDRFTPPEGTEALCETKPPEERLGGDYYLFDPTSPAIREFGVFGEEDAKVGAFARQVVLHQPLDYAEAVGRDVLAYYVPSSFPNIPYAGTALDPSLDWSVTLPPLDPAAARVERDTEVGMETFFDDFEVDKDAPGIELLHDYQRVFRFGATALTIATLLTLLGLLVGSRRTRVGTLLFGVGGLALLVAPTLSGVYIGRYTVPLAGLLAAGAAIAGYALWRAYGSIRPRRIA